MAESNEFHQQGSLAHAALLLMTGTISDIHAYGKIEMANAIKRIRKDAPKIGYSAKTLDEVFKSIYGVSADVVPTTRKKILE